jgi:hypothetical protein
MGCWLISNGLRNSGIHQLNLGFLKSEIGYFGFGYFRIGFEYFGLGFRVRKIMLRAISGTAGGHTLSIRTRYNPDFLKIPLEAQVFLAV